MKPALLSALLVASGAAFAQAPQPDPSLGRNLAATCANCHGTAGRAQPGMVPLAGQDAKALLQKLSEFRAGTRPATIMHQITKGYTEPQLEAIASYFAAQK